MNDIFLRIDSLRRQRGVTLSHLNAVMSNGYRGKLTEFKNGKTSLSDEDFSAIAKELSTSAEYLKTGKESDAQNEYSFNTDYLLLNSANRAAIDAAIAALLKSQKLED